MKLAIQLKVISILLGLMCVTEASAAEKPQGKAGNRIAVLDIDTSYKLEKGLSDTVAAAMRKEIAKAGKYEVLDGDMMNKVLGGRKCRITSYTKECFVELGRLLGVEKFITGNIVYYKGVHYFLFFLLDATTGEMENVAENECRDGNGNAVTSAINIASRLTNNKFSPKPDLINSKEFIEFTQKIWEAPSRAEWQKPEMVVGHLPIKPGDAVADLGAGTGYFTVWLSKTVGKKGTVYAVDIQKEMLDYIENRVKKEGLSNVRTVRGNPGDPSLPKDSIDLLFLCAMYYEIRNNNAYLMKLKEILKKGGKLAIIDHKVPDVPFAPPSTMYDSLLVKLTDNKMPRHILIPNLLDINHYRNSPSPVGPTFLVRIPREQVIEEVSKAGFKLYAEHEFLPYQYFLVFSKE